MALGLLVATFRSVNIQAFICAPRAVVLRLAHAAVPTATTRRR
jgi:hypothetical protein